MPLPLRCRAWMNATSSPQRLAARFCFLQPGCLVHDVIFQSGSHLLLFSPASSDFGCNLLASIRKVSLSTNSSMWQVTWSRNSHTPHPSIGICQRTSEGGGAALPTGPGGPMARPLAAAAWTQPGGCNPPGSLDPQCSYVAFDSPTQTSTDAIQSMSALATRRTQAFRTVCKAPSARRSSSPLPTTLLRPAAPWWKLYNLPPLIINHP